MAVDFSDVDRDGRVDIFVVDMLATERKRFQQMRQLMEGTPDLPGTIDFRVQRNRNTLFLRRSDGTYQEIANFAGVQASNWSWGMMFLDVDLDGYEDLLINNGYLWDQQNMDMNIRLAMVRDPQWQRTILRYPTLLEKNIAFRNMGDSTFQWADSIWGWGEELDVSHGLAAADVDGDGDLDIALNRMNAPALLYRNDAQAARVAVRLRGRGRSTQGIGSKIRILGGSVPLQVKEVSSGGLYLSHAEPLYTFAAGAAEHLTIEIEWRSGRRSLIEDAKPGRLYEISEPESGSTGASVAGSSAAASPANFSGTSPEGGTPLFEDVSRLIGPAYHNGRDVRRFCSAAASPHEALAAGAGRHLARLGPGWRLRCHRVLFCTGPERLRTPSETRTPGSGAPLCTAALDADECGVCRGHGGGCDRLRTTAGVSGPGRHPRSYAVSQPRRPSCIGMWARARVCGFDWPDAPKTRPRSGPPSESYTQVGWARRGKFTAVPATGRMTIRYRLWDSANHPRRCGFAGPEEK